MPRIIPTSLAIKSMRDSGYSNTAKAVAELIDNSVQHGASVVSLIMVEKPHVGLNSTYRIDTIAVLDDGVGMSEETLEMALQFGGGTNGVLTDSSLGKFGFGLPNSSISQARRVDVWTWKSGPESAIYTYLDIDKIIAEDLDLVPQPIKKTLPEDIHLDKFSLGQSGTLVVWSKLDKVLWKTGKSIIKHSSFQVGRMYRYFLDKELCTLKAFVFHSDKRNIVDSTEIVKNDPLYLMTETSVTPLLQEYIESGLEDPPFSAFDERRFKVRFEDVEGEVIVRSSLAKESTRKGENAGNRSYGKHAAENVGISVIRANRELLVDSAWVNSYDPRERWWGMEVSFPPSLDVVFGVTNNKQSAVNFTEFAKISLTQILKEENLSMQAYMEQLRVENDPKADLIPIVNYIQETLRALRDQIKAQSKQLERPLGLQHRHNHAGPERVATVKTKERIEDGIRGDSDGYQGDREEVFVVLKETLMQNGVADVDGLVDSIVESSTKYAFVTAALDSREFFSVSPTAGRLLIKINSKHPAYDGLLEVLENENSRGLNDSEARLLKARNGLKLLLMSWARLEDETPTPAKQVLQDRRVDWGRVAWSFFED
jgi:hypothetical protein